MGLIEQQWEQNERNQNDFFENFKLVSEQRFLIFKAL